MKKIFFAGLTLVASNAFASRNGLNYECANLNGVTENKAIINIQGSTAKAVLAYNNTATYLNLTQTALLKTPRPHVLMTFTGENNEALKIVFNLTYPSASLYTVDQNGEQVELAKTTCKKVNL